MSPLYHCHGLEPVQRPHEVQLVGDYAVDVLVRGRHLVVVAPAYAEDHVRDRRHRLLVRYLAVRLFAAEDPPGAVGAGAEGVLRGETLADVARRAHGSGDSQWSLRLHRALAVNEKLAAEVGLQRSEVVVRVDNLFDGQIHPTDGGEG